MFSANVETKEERRWFGGFMMEIFPYRQRDLFSGIEHNRVFCSALERFLYIFTLENLQ